MKNVTGHLMYLKVRFQHFKINNLELSLFKFRNPKI